MERVGEPPLIRIFPDLDAATAALAARVASEAAWAITARGEFRLGLSGGETPVTLYRLLASDEWRGRIEWVRTTLLFADERCVPVGGPERNDRLVRETLATPLAIPEARIRPMRGEADDPDAAARDYERVVSSPIDLLLLGMGPDGHIASLFPGGRAVLERERRVVAVLDSPKPPPRRLTVTPRTIGEARAVCVLAGGEAKALAAASALDGRVGPAECPAAWVAARDWYLDRAAASRRSVPF